MKNNELSRVWGKKLFESDDKGKNNGQSERVFLPPIVLVLFLQKVRKLVLFHINRKYRNNSLNKGIWLIERILHLSPCSQFFHDTGIIHLREVLRYLWWGTIRESSYLPWWKWIDSEKKIDNLQATIRCECTKYICHIDEDIFFLKHFWLNSCKVCHNNILNTLSFYEIMKWKQENIIKFSWKLL